MHPLSLILAPQFITSFFPLKIDNKHSISSHAAFHLDLGCVDRVPASQQYPPFYSQLSSPCWLQRAQMPFWVSYLSFLLTFTSLMTIWIGPSTTSASVIWSQTFYSFMITSMYSFHILPRSSLLKPSLPFLPSCIFPPFIIFPIFFHELHQFENIAWFCIQFFLIPGQPRLSWFLLLPFSFDFLSWCIVTYFLLIYYMPCFWSSLLLSHLHSTSMCFLRVFFLSFSDTVNHKPSQLHS